MAVLDGVARNGAGGGVVVKYLSGLTAGNTFLLTIGAGGAGGTAAGLSATAGGSGGNSTLSSGTQTITTLTAKGGGGGGTVSSATDPYSVPGTGVNGDLNIPGGHDGPAALGLGPDPIPALGFDHAGNAGLGYGGGGSGAKAASILNAQPGGAGAPGCCIIEWYA